MRAHLQISIWTLLEGGATKFEIKRNTIRSYRQRFAADPAKRFTLATVPGAGCHTGGNLLVRTPPRFLDAQLCLGRNATAI